MIHRNGQSIVGIQFGLFEQLKDSLRNPVSSYPGDFSEGELISGEQVNVVFPVIKSKNENIFHSCAS